jgi:hypothetical protein
MLNLYESPSGTHKRLLASGQIAQTIDDALVAAEGASDPFSVACVYCTILLLVPGQVVFNNNPFMVRPGDGERFTCLSTTADDGSKFKPFGLVKDFGDEQVQDGAVAYSIPPGHPATRFRHFSTIHEGIREGLFALLRDARARLLREFLVPQRVTQSASELTEQWVTALTARGVIKNTASARELAARVWAESYHVALRLASDTLKPLAMPQPPLYTAEYGWVIPLKFGR